MNRKQKIQWIEISKGLPKEDCELLVYSKFLKNKYLVKFNVNKQMFYDIEGYFSYEPNEYDYYLILNIDNPNE